MKTIIYCVVLTVLLSGQILSFDPKPASAADPIKLKAVTFLPTFLPLMTPVTEIFVPKVNKALEGELIIEILGGPEVFPALEQPEAVRTGAVDISFTAGGDYPQLVPESDLLPFTEYSPWEERKMGIYDYWVDVHKQGNFYYLGKWLWGPNFYFHFHGKRVEKFTDLTGLKITDVGGEGIFLKKFGMVQVDLTADQIYSSLERGLIDGFTWSNLGYFPGWEEVVRHILDEPFYEMNLVTIINLDTWNRLPKHLRERLIKIQAEFEHEAAAWASKQAKKERYVMLDAGVKIVKLPPDESKKFIDSIKRYTWEYYAGVLPPEVHRKAKKTITK
jgi:TRAP-type mannitol/chloroaromatic compound transport system substrate-binding protein